MRGLVERHRRADNALFLLAEDGMGLTLTETTVEPGSVQDLWYKYHLEANYIVEGEGELEDVATGARHPLKPGTRYAAVQPMADPVAGSSPGVTVPNHTCRPWAVQAGSSVSWVKA